MDLALHRSQILAWIASELALASTVILHSSLCHRKKKKKNVLTMNNNPLNEVTLKQLDWKIKTELHKNVLTGKKPF